MDKTGVMPTADSDQAFLHSLYEENKRFMYYVARKYTSTAEDVEDILQETTVRLIKNISALRKISCCNLRRYIVLTIRAVYLDMERKRQKEVVLSLDDAEMEALLRRELLDETGNDGTLARLDVWRLERQLSPRDWALLHGRYIQDLSDEALGQLLGVTPSSVRMLLTRARKNARNILLDRADKGGDNDE